MKKFAIRAWEFLYYICAFFAYPINAVLSLGLRKRVYQDSVLHVSRMGHIPFFMVQRLRTSGKKVDYMAIGTSPVWHKCDYNVRYSILPFIRIFQEMYWFWAVAARYETIHYHFIMTLAYSGWDLPILKKMGRKIVMHFRGCDIREREKNMELNPEINICQKCDYYIPYEKKYGCQVGRVKRRRELAVRYGDAFLVTTPDLKDFVPGAVYLPLFAPQAGAPEKKSVSREINIVHVTNHPGIEGTDEIEAVMEGLKKEGFAVNFRKFSGISYDKALEAYAGSDLSIGKLKMGYYANSQIESMYCGTPAITFVRPRFMTEDMRNSGFIFSSIERLKDTMEYLLAHPEEIAKKRSIARESILRLHDNEVIARRLLGLYDDINGR